MSPDPFRSTSLPGLRRSAGLKLILICALVLLMAIPAMLIGAISYERSTAANEVTRQVSQRYGGQQTVIGPILSVPYETKLSDGTVQTGHYIIYPDSGAAVFDSVNVENKMQSLYKVPVYSAKGELSARFDDPLSRLEKTGVTLQRRDARFLISLSDVRGLKRDIQLRDQNGQTAQFEPASEEAQSRPGVPAVYGQNLEGGRIIVKAAIPGRQHEALPRFGQWLSVSAVPFFTDSGEVSVSAELYLSGAQSLSFPPFAKSTQVSLASNWADPGFQGEFTPIEREISDEGFTANWSMPYLSRGIRGQGRAEDVLRGLTSNMVRVKFVNTDNPYQTVNRALKYSVLFIGLVFLAYFLFEIIVGTPVHPAQYILIGLAQAIFYLLLLAFAERIGFVPAFLIASVLTIVVTAGYAGAVFGGRSYIWKAGSVFAIVYGLLFVLMRMEDFALMVGALASFTAIAATMYLTRDVDWYGAGKAIKTG
ncbi:MAG: cell envelope integrity protein CreD [Litorimonas sp.]